MSFAQLTYRESLRDIETCLRSMSGKLYHMGLRRRCSAINIGRRQRVARLADLRRFRTGPNRHRAAVVRARSDWRDLDQSLYALDSTTIDLCLSLFPWAKFRKSKGASRCTRCSICMATSPHSLAFTDGKVHDVNILDEIVPEAGAFYVIDRGYIDFERLFVLTLCSSFFVTRTKENVLLQRRYSHPVDKSTGVRSDQTVILTAIDSAMAYPTRCGESPMWTQ